MDRVKTHTEETELGPVTWHEAPMTDGGTPVLWLHGVPTNGRQWRPFLEAMGGVAPDLPGFGTSTKRGDLAYDLPFYVTWLEGFLQARGIDRFRLVGQDWGGGFAAALAQAMPDRVERLALVDAVPLTPGFRWHRIARVWRTRGAGELFMTFWVRPATWALLRSVPAAHRRLVDEHNDVGTQRAILRLYRASGPEVLAEAGARLGDVTCPALVLWGERDPYLPTRYADAYAALLGGEVEREELAGAGHWPWLDRPEVVERVATFLRG